MQGACEGAYSWYAACAGEKGVVKGHPIPQGLLCRPSSLGLFHHGRNDPGSGL